MDQTNEGEKFTFFWTKDSPFSQHHLTKFTVAGITYTSAEQYMMRQKAILFGDTKSENGIMNTDCPKTQKRLGRYITGFNQLMWDEYKLEIVRQGNYHKINQNPGIQQTLHDTMGTTLVEASPHDYYWGIGLRENDARSLQRATWLGENKLGEMLTDLRDNVFLEFKSINTIISSLHPKIKQQRQEEENEQLQLQQLSPQLELKQKAREAERFTFFNGGKSIYHINFMADFKIANVTYNSVQQYRQFCKAKLFDDDVRASQIMNATKADEQRRLGSHVTHFDKKVWNEKTVPLMQEANFHKFTQNDELKQELLATSGSTLALACPFRGDWGTGYFVDEPNCHSRPQ